MSITDPSWPRADVWLAGDHAEADLIVVGVPSSKASLTTSRADLAPLEMRERLHRFSTFHGESGVDFGDIRVRDLGNWPVSELDMNLMPPVVHDMAHSLPQADLLLYLGGDNAITRPLVTALDHDLAQVGVITFDAHHDVRTLDRGPSNGTPIRGLVTEDGLPGRNVVQIGIHSFANSSTYRAFCDDAGISVITAGEVAEKGAVWAVARAFERLAHCERIYVDVDVDVLDSAYAPACPGARPGGLAIRQLAEGVFACASRPQVAAMDFVEVDPSADVRNQTVDVMAHLFLSAVAGYASR